MALLPYRCIWDTVEIDLDEDEDFAFITVLMRHWKFDELVGTLTAAGSSECVVSLDDVLNEEERPVFEAMMHRLTELGIREECYGGIISGLIGYIEEEIISNISPPVSVTMDIVEATPAVATDDIQEALEMYLMEVDVEEGSMRMEIDTTGPPSKAAIAEMMEKLQRCEADKEGEELFCVICMEEADEEVAGFALMPCKHIFHVTCVAKWFTINPLCPLCRRYSQPED